MTRRAAHRTAARLRRAALVAASITLLSGSAALAWEVQRTNPTNRVTALTLAEVTGASAIKNGGNHSRCTGVTVSWNAAPSPADTYRVDRRVGRGAWEVARSDTAGATSWVDDATYTGSEVTYRIHTRIKDAQGSLSSWMSAGVEASVLCNTVGDVTDLAVVDVDCTARLTWTPARNAIGYHIHYSTNGGSTWKVLERSFGSSATDSYTVSAALAGTVQFRVTPVGGNPSNVVQVEDMGFAVRSIALGGDADDRIEPGETITVVFNRAVDTATPSGANSNGVYVQRNGSPGLYLAAGSNVAVDAGIGYLRTSRGNWAASGVQAGTVTRPAPDTWVWTKGAGILDITTPRWTTFTPGAGAAGAPGPARCAGSGRLLGASTPAVSGRF